MSKEEIEILVLQRYPIKDAEKTCLAFRERREKIRADYRKLLTNDNGTGNTGKAAKN